MADAVDLKSMDFVVRVRIPYPPPFTFNRKRKERTVDVDYGYKTNPTPDTFLEEFVKFYNDEIADSDVPKIELNECFIVWYNFTLGNAKALVSTYRLDRMYYEMTYNKEKNELYIDAYLKVKHDCVKF